MKDKEGIKLLKRYNRLCQLSKMGLMKTKKSFDKSCKYKEEYNYYVKCKLSTVLNKLVERNIIFPNSDIKSMIKSNDYDVIIIAANIIYLENKFRWKKK